MDDVNWLYMQQRDKAVGHRLREWRAERDMTQAALAEALGVSRITVVSWERDGVPLSTLRMLSLAMRELQREVPVS